MCIQHTYCFRKATVKRMLRQLTYSIVAFYFGLQTAHADFSVSTIGLFSHGSFDEGASEIVDYDSKTKRLYVTNGETKSIDILDITTPSQPRKVGAIEINDLGEAPNSVAVHEGLVAVAVEAEDHTEPGQVGLFTGDGELIAAYEVGALPDMVTFTPDGKHLIVACEGEPSDDYTVDPAGAIAVIDISAGADQAKVTLAGFQEWNDKIIPEGARIVRPGRTAEQDFEPEFVAVSPDSSRAFVTLQENNAIAIVDVDAGKISEVVGLGYKDHRSAPFDASNKDGKINLKTWPVLGMYQPDSIAVFETGGATYLVTANEGDARDYDGWSEETRVSKLLLDPQVFPNAADLQAKTALGRLKTTTTMGDVDGDGDHDQIYAYGARSFSIWDVKGRLVYDSGDEIERMLAQRMPSEFNSTDDENGSFDDRSDDKGPEPEAIAVGNVKGKTFAFIGLERLGGFVIYDVSNPASASFVDYVNTRNFAGDPEAGTAGNLAPEGIVFIESTKSPNGKPLLAIAYEVSGTTEIVELNSD